MVKVRLTVVFRTRPTAKPMVVEHTLPRSLMALKGKTQIKAIEKHLDYVYYVRNVVESSMV